MAEILIIFGIALIIAITSFISSTGKLLDRRKEGLKIITKRGWFLIALNFVVILLSVAQYILNENKLHQKDVEASNKQAIRDSILKSNYDSSLFVLKNKFDTSNIKIVSTISQTLGEYGYLLDSAQKSLVKIIKDSSKTKIITQEDPILSICSFEGIKLEKNENDKYYYNLKFCSEGAGCTGFNVTASIVLSDSMPSNYFIYLKDNLVLSNEIQIPKDAAYVKYFNFSDKLKYTLLYVYVNGAYTNIQRTKTYNIDAVYYYNKIVKTSGMVEGETRKNIISFIQKNK